MATISSTILLLTAAFIVAYVFAQAVRGTVDLLTTRNMFLAGFIIFQVTGAAFAVILDVRGNFQPADVPRSSLIYTTLLLIFLAIFLFTYMKITPLIDKVLSRRVRGAFRFSDASLLIIAVTTIPLGIISQFILVYIPVLGPGFRMLGFGLFSVAVGLASWVWFKRLLNPVIMLISCTIILVAMLLTFHENFGRRPLLGILMVIGWAAYYSHWRYLGLKSVLKRGVIIGGAGFFLLALVTSARQGEFRNQSALQNITSLKNASFSEGAIDLFTGQNAGLYSMWLIESRPDKHPYDTLHSVRMVLFFPIPRALWHNKPDALAITMPKYELKISGKPEGWNIGPGLIGHIVNDNPWIALWLYPILFAVIFRFFDRVVVWFPDNPFLVLPMGAALGQITAVPRGEVGSFMFNALLNIFGSLAIMLVISTVLKIFGFIRLEPLDEYDEDEYEDQYDSEYDREPMLEEGYGDAQEYC